MKVSTFSYLLFVFIHPLRFALPNVALGSATLRGHRMTSSHSSKGPLRPLSQGDSLAGAVIVFRL